jgi:hypothetical protein
MMGRLLVFAVLCASCTALSLTPERPKAHKVLVLRGGEVSPVSKLALGANFATWGFYGANLLARPNFILQSIMMAPAAMDFLAPNYAVAQYLGAFYLSQTGRMAMALTPGNNVRVRGDLLGATVINTLLCLTSASRIAQGVPSNAVTLGLVAGQGAMAALSFVGFCQAPKSFRLLDSI